MRDLPLCPPPGYEYETTGPWWVVHVDDDKASAWTMWTLESAIMRFWLATSVPQRKVMVDAYGINILGVDGTSDQSKMVGTRQTMEATLDLVRRGTIGLETEAAILVMAETLRAMNGATP